jgi:hypothetical protein
MKIESANIDQLIELKKEVVLTCKGFGIPENAIPKATVIFLKNYEVENNSESMLTYGELETMINSLAK